MKYRKKSMIVDAAEWYPGKTTIVGVDTEPSTGRHFVFVGGKRHYLIPGDWILKSPDGSYLPPVGAALFEMDYEPA